MKKKYTQPKMINWYYPRMLLSIGLKAVISGTFGNYADRRELEAALTNNADDTNEWETIQKEYCKENDIWIDVINDTGDGFNSTFTIAKTVAKDVLNLTYKDDNGNMQSVNTKRGKILIFGGDEVYPFPTMDEYENRFKIPFASACNDLAELKREANRPHLYAIPGNHDWYDGLGNFIKLFCQQRRIGIWSTQQHRSYFALPLPNHYWVWATDIQLNLDIDAPQLSYFETIAKKKMSEGDKIILVTAEPAWIYKQIHPNDRSFAKLDFFIQKYIHDKGLCIGKQFKLAATLTGDLHHYSRYCNPERPNGHQYITAGGGGAFLHLTHNLPDKLTHMNNNIRQQRIFPDKKNAKRLLLGNFIFPYKNFVFTLLIFFIYLLFFWIIYINQLQKTSSFPILSFPSVYDYIKEEFFVLTSHPNNSITSFFSYILHTLYLSPVILLMTLFLGCGFYAFTDVNVCLAVRARIIGIIHALGHIILLYSFIYFLEKMITYDIIPKGVWWQKLLAILICCGTGSFIAGFFMGAYLYISNRLLGMHINEASSSLASPNYKNFLRLHIHADGVTIFPVGIKKTPKKWKQHYHEAEDRFSFTGNEINTELLEKPIYIHNDQLL